MGLGKTQVLIFGKISLQLKLVRKEKDGYFIVIEGTDCHSRGQYDSNHVCSKYRYVQFHRTYIDVKLQITSSTAKMGYFNTLLSRIILLSN